MRGENSVVSRWCRNRGLVRSLARVASVRVVVELAVLSIVISILIVVILLQIRMMDNRLLLLLRSHRLDFGWLAGVVREPVVHALARNLLGTLIVVGGLLRVLHLVFVVINILRVVVGYLLLDRREFDQLLLLVGRSLGLVGRKRRHSTFACNRSCNMRGLLILVVVVHVLLLLGLLLVELALDPILGVPVRIFRVGVTLVWGLVKRGLLVLVVTLVWQRRRRHAVISWIYGCRVLLVVIVGGL